MSAAAAPGTKDRVLAAATALFAERGFHGTKIRDIADRAGVNVASGHYHFGSKKRLYLEVLREQFARTRGELVRGGGSVPAAALPRLSRRALEALLRARLKVMLDLLIGPPAGLHGTLMQREMCDPSEALPVIVAEFIEPMMKEMREIVAHLEPRLGRRGVADCVYSMIGQTLFYRFARPAVLGMLGVSEYAPGYAADRAGHIVAFSLGGITRVAAGRRSHAG